MASSRLVFFSDALNLSLGTSRTHHRATHKNLYSEFSTLYTKRRGAHTHLSTHTRICFFSKKEDDDPRLLHLEVTHASVATNCSVLYHPTGSIMDVPIYYNMSRYIYILTNGRHVLWNRGSGCHQNG